MTVNKFSNVNNVRIERMTCARIPTEFGEFQLCHYRNDQDDKEHLAFVCGDVVGKENVLVRVHSECFTGDVLGSLRCDCGPQLQRSLQLIAAEACGVVIYLRQEGRNIGLLDKLRAYNLQDAGYDTVDANLMLGHQADSRDYRIAALILEDLGLSSIRLLTNNPQKIEDIRNYGIRVTARIPIQTGINQENLRYLTTKADRMRHMLDLDNLPIPGNGTANRRPVVTLSYAQSLDGSITARRGQTLAISGEESLVMTHQLRAEHDAILVGIGTVLADDPQLTVRLVDGKSPQPIILDSRLRFPLDARLLEQDLKPWIITGEEVSSKAVFYLEQVGARIWRMPVNQDGWIDLSRLLASLISMGISSLMVEGGARIITSFLREGLVDRLALTISPNLIAGLPAVERSMLANTPRLPQLQQTFVRQLGSDIIVIGEFAPE